MLWWLYFIEGIYTLMWHMYVVIMKKIKKKLFNKTSQNFIKHFIIIESERKDKMTMVYNDKLINLFIGSKWNKEY